MFDKSCSIWLKSSNSYIFYLRLLFHLNTLNLSLLKNGQLLNKMSTKRLNYVSENKPGIMIYHPACRVYLFSHYTLPDMSLCLPIWDPTPGGQWNESGFRPPLCTYRLNWARRTSWGWWDDWDDTVLQTQDSKFEPWRSEVEHATSRSRRLPAILTFTRGWGRNIFCFFQTAETGNRTPNSGVKGSGANHYPRAPALQEDTCASRATPPKLRHQS